MLLNYFEGIEVHVKLRLAGCDGDVPLPPFHFTEPATRTNYGNTKIKLTFSQDILGFQILLPVIVSHKIAGLHFEAINCEWSEINNEVVLYPFILWFMYSLVTLVKQQKSYFFNGRVGTYFPPPPPSPRAEWPLTNAQVPPALYPLPDKWPGHYNFFSSDSLITQITENEKINLKLNCFNNLSRSSEW